MEGSRRPRERNAREFAIVNSRRFLEEDLEGITLEWVSFDGSRFYYASRLFDASRFPISSSPFSRPIPLCRRTRRPTRLTLPTPDSKNSLIVLSSLRTLLAYPRVKYERPTRRQGFLSANFNGNYDDSIILRYLSFLRHIESLKNLSRSISIDSI